jgi:hypothetical protein
MNRRVWYVAYGSNLAPAYLETMAIGLRESRDWDDEQVSTYLNSLFPG